MYSKEPITTYYTLTHNIMAYHILGVNTYMHVLCLLVDLDFLYTSCVKLSHKEIVPRIQA